ncbi:hypothetical protein U1Q18_016611 [Sarracenia purpurea var. burkii]
MGDRIEEEEEGSSEHQRHLWRLSGQAGPKPPPSAQARHSIRVVLKPAHKSNHWGAKELRGLLSNDETIIATSSRVRFTILWHQTKEKRVYSSTEGKRSPPASSIIPWPPEIPLPILLSEGVPAITPTLTFPSTKMNGEEKEEKEGLWEPEQLARLGDQCVSPVTAMQIRESISGKPRSTEIEAMKDILVTHRREKKKGIQTLTPIPSSSGIHPRSDTSDGTPLHSLIPCPATAVVMPPSGQGSPSGALSRSFAHHVLSMAHHPS